MTSRPAGRHRKGATPQRPPRPQGLFGYPGDRAPGYYLNSGIVPNGRPLLASSGGRQALRAAVARDRRTFTMAPAETAAPTGKPSASTTPTPAPGRGRKPGPARDKAPRPRSRGRHRRAPALEVRYRVDHQWPGGFQGEVRVVNHGARAIEGWEVMVALPEDTVTAVWNANGFVSNHILLLGPASPAQVVPAGGTLDVFFAAAGPETAPQACAFDGTLCG